MKILLVTGHPAQVHNFKYLKSELEARGHQVFWLATDKDISKYLLDYYKIDYTVISRPGKSHFSKLRTLIKNTWFTKKFIRKNKIDLAFSRVSPYVALACFLLHKTHFALTDTESAALYDKFFGRFVSVLFTSKSFKRTLRKDQVWFDANIELFYLHPNKFKPLENVGNILNIKRDEPYIILRFVSWDAYHDKGLTGFTDINKLKAVTVFSKYAKIFISSEKELPAELAPFQIKIPPERMHDVLAHALLFFGESATMASESAVLGTPAIFLDKVGRGYTDHEATFELVYNFGNSLESQEKAINKGLELIQDQGLKDKMHHNHKKFMKDKIDVTAFMVWFIENYPESNRIMQENPDYQYRFK
jgi:predicted glycosyltransferase